MVEGKHKNPSNRNQGYLASSKPSSKYQIPDTNTPDKQDSDLKLHLMILTENFKKDKNNSIKEIQENTGKLVERRNTKIP